MTPLPPPTYLVLRRLAPIGVGILGHIEDDESRSICCTYELPWRDNEPKVSCIPAGTYPMIRYRSPKRGYDVWLLQHVPGREYEEIHIGNSAPDTEGCILVGTHYGFTEKGYGVVNSKEAFTALMNATAGIDRLELRVLDAVPVTEAGA